MDSGDLFKLAVIIIAGLYIYVIFRVSLLNQKINNSHKNWEDEIRNLKEAASGRGMTMPMLEREIEVINKKYKPKIEELERKRRFYLDDIPFIKK